jgi:hypothetical protein
MEITHIMISEYYHKQLVLVVQLHEHVKQMMIYQHLVYVHHYFLNQAAHVQLGYTPQMNVFVIKINKQNIS